LVTLLAVFSLGLLVSFVSHSPRSWGFPFEALLPSRCRDVSIATRPLAVSPTSYEGIATSTAKPAAAPGFLPLKNAWSYGVPKHVFLQLLPWGYSFLGFFCSPVLTLFGSPLMCFVDSAPKLRSHMHFRVSIGGWLVAGLSDYHPLPATTLLRFSHPSAP
jgi:hypothetical protein